MTTAGRNFDEGLNREILRIGIPSFLETLFTTFASIIDSKMVSAMGVTAISAVSVTNQPRLFVYSIFFAINTVTTSLIAKYHGKADQETANRILDHAVRIILILSIALSVLAVGLAGPIMTLFSGQPDTLADSVLYFRIVMGGMIFNLLFMEINSALRGFGMTKLTFADNVLSCVVNLFFNYLLIEGHWGFPALGTGLQTSAVTLIGRSYGEKNRKRISDYRKAITKLGMISSRSPVSILLLLPCLFWSSMSEYGAYGPAPLPGRRRRHFCFGAT